MNQITKEQKKFLSKFICVRISKHPKNDDFIKSFECERNKNLVLRLQSDAFNEDCTGVTAHYLIVYDNTIPVIYFALKAGSLFSPLEHTLQEMGKQVLKKWNDTFHNDTIEDIYSIIDKVNSYPCGFPDNIVDICKSYDILQRDVYMEKETKTFQVTHTYAGIELEMFCVNDNARSIWIEAKTFHTLGETMYWSKIVPIFFKVQNLIGCKYCFLFAADNTPDETLVNYYNVALKFERMVNIGTTKPEYDFMCIPMFCDLNTLKSQRKDFFNNFNEDETELA